MGEGLKSILLVYASQTGNAEAIAQVSLRRFNFIARYILTLASCRTGNRRRDAREVRG
jgi:hypothetical protein